MAVIINEFEVVVEPTEEPTEGEAEYIEPQPQLTPQDIHNIIERRIGRVARIWAH